MSKDNARQYTRPYVVTSPGGQRDVIRRVSSFGATPTTDSLVIGPFKTTRGAEFVKNNPTFAGTITEAERAAVQEDYNKSMTTGSGS